MKTTTVAAAAAAAVVFTSIFMLVACAGGRSHYGKTITDHLMAKAPAGYSVEIADIEELVPLTVADSIVILQDEFENNRKEYIERLHGVRSLSAMSPDNAWRIKQEKVLSHSIDSLENVPVPAFYEGVPTGKVLAVPVRCRYVISAVGTSETITETFDFWLTPDGNKVLYQRRSK
jgi:hypothetical protein